MDYFKYRGDFLIFSKVTKTLYCNIHCLSFTRYSVFQFDRTENSPFVRY